MVRFEDVKNDEKLNIYIKEGNKVLGTMGYTDHSKAHTTKVGYDASHILKTLGYDERTCELAKIAGYIHDIGNIINRVDHAHTGAIMAFLVLERLEMDPEEISLIISAIGNHDEGTGNPISPINAALIIADKSDVRRSRVRNPHFPSFDIHDRVNYAVEKASLDVDNIESTITLHLDIDTEISSVMDYFEIFISRMTMCRRAAHYLDTTFHLYANNAKLL